MLEICWNGSRKITSIKVKNIMSNQKNAFYQSTANLIQAGNTKMAISSLIEFLNSQVDDENALSLLSSAYMRQGDQEKAIEISKKAANAHPNSFEAHADLGFLSMKLGYKEQAISSFEAAVMLNKPFYQGWAFLGKLYFENNQFSQALAATAESEKYDPLDNEYHQMRSAMQNGRLKEGEKIARQMLEKIPGHPRAGYMLANIAARVGFHEERAEILLHCLSFHPANEMLRKQLIKSYEELAEYGNALEQAIILIEAYPSYLNHWIKSQLHSDIGQFEEALSEADKSAQFVLDNKVELGKVELIRAHALRFLGRREESERAYKACIEFTPDSGTGWWGLADLKDYQFTDKDKQSMEDFYVNEENDSKHRSQVAFAIANALDNSGKKDRAFTWYKKANEERRDLDFDLNANNKFSESSISVLTKEALEKQASPTPDGPTPIFIVGMPRAGSTLLEQILASHSQIEGTMELPTLAKLERKIKNFGRQTYSKDFPQSLIEFTPEQLCKFGQMYFENSACFRTDKPYFIDKLPMNYDRVGLIHKIIPQAIIIDARRHPLDCGYSIYKQHFAPGQEYSYDLENIGSYYNYYLKKMDHWDQVLPGKVLCVQYEDMVHETEATIRLLLEHVGVPFEESCLRFYDNKRAVRTASSEQVRQPINTKGIGQWKPFEEQLKPLKISLGAETMARFEKYLPK